MKMPAALAKQYGPLPGWVWLVALVGGFALAYTINKRNQVPDEPVDDAIPTGDADFANIGGGFPLPGGQVVTTEPGTREVETNMEWLRVVLNDLIARGISSAAADTALRRYLNGQELDPQQIAIIELALNLHGPPPEGTSPITPVPAPEPPVGDPTPDPVEEPDSDPTPTPTPTPEQPPSGGTYTVLPGESIWLIAKKTLRNAWGRTPSNGEIDPYWRQLVNLNRNRIRSKNPDLIYAGEKLLLPPVPAKVG